MLMILRNSKRFSRSPTGCVQIIINEKSTNNNKTSSSSDSSSGSESDEKPTRSRKIPDPRVIDRLNQLLLQIPNKQESESTINLARPTSKRTGKKEVKKDKSSEDQDEAQVIKAASDVAQLIGGNDIEQTESELLSRLLTSTAKENGATYALNDVIKGMQIDREKQEPDDQSRAFQVRQLLEKSNMRFRKSYDTKSGRRPISRTDKFPRETTFAPVDLFGSEPLGIFTNKADLKESSSLSTWKEVHKKQLQLAITHPPANYFQQMILWTKQGKLWRFPIDNESGMDEEAKTDFTEHIFLEDHLESWCPQKGPIRHFMELVCYGLSKNHYLTVTAKKEHIEWYRNYFESKRSLLEEIGAYPPAQSTEKKSDSKEH